MGNLTMTTRAEWNRAAADAVQSIAAIGRPADGHLVILSAILAGRQTSLENYRAAAAQCDRIETQRRHRGRRAHLERIGR